ncbi:MAG: DUF1080 domain-containing protein [Pirellulales bacterium]|nr:DUF1080 domain-containing protein [Pirellulales bacterium]
MRTPHQIFLGICPILVLASVANAADSKAVVITDSNRDGIDFGVQGEYLGEAESCGIRQSVGAQLIALGGGKFRAVLFPGGLPGAGWSRGDETGACDCTLTDGVLQFFFGEAKVETRDGKTSIRGGAKKRCVFDSVTRESLTLGAKPPEGAVVLFDGTSSEQFENSELVDGKYLAASNVSTKKRFGDHFLHLEFRTPFMPDARGQGRGNSGVYVQSRYEIQVLDSFGLEGEDNECGGIYSIAKPAVNMCLPPLSWQTYDIDFRAARYDSAGEKTANARITVKHNGVVIHNDIELPRATPGRHPEGPGPDALFLQNHGNPVLYRNIWVVEK